MDFVKDHPQVFFPSDSQTDRLTFGFMFFRDGKAWASVSLEDARAGVPAIPSPLDPQLLEALPELSTGEKRFQYLGQIPRG